MIRLGKNKMGYSETTISQHRRLLLVLGIVLFTSLAMHTATARNDSAKLGPLVQQLADEYDRAGRGATTQFAKKRGIRIRELQDGACIPVILEPTAKNRARFLPQQRLCDLGCTVDAVSTSYVRLLVPPRALRHLEGHPGVHIARAPFQAVELLGPNLSESVELTAADAMHTAGFTGDGVKVGVVDLGFIGLAARISDGELPANTVMVDLPGTNDDIPESNTEHGVGVSEHVTDMAPDAQVFCFMALDSVDLQNAADYARDNGISVINHSVGWVNVSYYDDTGRINDIINTSFDTDGVFWTVSAGNSAFRHWRGVWTDDDVDNRLDFALNDDALAITSSSSNVRLFLNWDQYGASLTDLDFYVFDKDDNQVAQSIAPQTGPHSPTERINFTYDPVLAPYYIEVQWFSGPTAGLDVTIFSFDNNIEHPVPAAALMDPADAHGAYTIAAIYQGYWNQPSPPRESFSSEGPTTDGRQKPDISAPDGTTSKTYGITGSFGTSFSSPTTAGAAALLLEEDPSRTAEDLAARLTALAEDIGTPGLDSVFGAGKLHLEPAATIDTSAPTITCPADLTIECDQPTGPANTGQATASNECAVTLSYSDVATPLVDCGAVTYLDSGQPIGAAATLDVALGDLDGDGDQDIVFGNVAGELNQVWTNDGTGIYSDSGQTLTSRFTAVAIGDVDGDLDLDVITATSSPLGNVVYINDGAGNFSPGPTLGTAGVQDVEVGDVDGDVDLDVVLIKPGLLPNEVWLNDGEGGYLNSGQALGLNNSFGGALADVDNDNDLDLFVANVGPNRIYLNDGTGIFNDSGQLLGGLSSRDVMLGDLDDDNDIDAFVANIGTNNVWLNDGTGTFSLNQSLPFNIDYDLDMADIDSDGDLDVLIGSITTPNRLWLNDGTATFSISTQSVGTGFTFSVALGDVDGDSDIDIVVGNTGLNTNEVYFNDDCSQCGDIIARTWTATGCVGKTTSCTQTITLEDTTGPVLTCPANVSISCSDLATNADATGSASATDACGGIVNISFSDSASAGNCASESLIARTWTGDDGCGNASTCTQIITFADTTAPSISCPTNTTIECDQSSAPGTTGTATATDNCDPAPAIGFTDSIAAGSCIGASVITRTWTATDVCGNVDSCQQLITTADTEMPLLTTPGNVSVQCADPVSPGDTGNATATDNCDPAPQVMFTDDIVSGTCPYETTITRRWTAEDDCGNTTVGVQTITVLDTTEPLIACPAGVTIECDASTGPGNTGAATATDNCDSNPSFSYSNNSATGACTEESVITRTWMVVDACGNVDGCIQLITRVDTTAPTIAAPADIAIDCDDSTAPSNTGTPIVSDNCNLSPATTFFDSISSNSCNDDYVITRTWTATDGCSNSANDIQTISISDTTAPSVACPGNVSIECDTSSAPGATSTATATDNCDGAPVISHSDATAGSCPTVITRTWTATDSCGNVDSCQQTITLEDNAGPVIGCPADLAIECGMSTDPTSTDQATATDDCTVTTSFSDVTESSVFCLSLSYIDSGQALGAGVTLDTAVGDLDGDGDLDAVHANIAGALNQVWFNDGAGVFTDSGQSFTPGFAVVALGDVDGDLDLDVVTATLSPLGNQIYLNDGTGTLSPGATLGTTAARDLKIGDVDGDNDLDIILIRSGPVPNELWLNDGTGTYTNSGQLLGTSSSIGGALADLDNDNDLDLFVANSGPNRVYLNDGSGTFTDSAQLLGFLSSWNVVLGDIDGDNDVDAFVANVGTNNVWVNDGSGTFTLNQTFPFNIDFDLDMGDVDGDGDLDVVTGSITTPNRVWLNNGTGTFTDSGQLAGSKFTMAVALGDLDGDGDLDITVSNTGMQPNEVFLNEDCDECGSTITRTWTATNCAGNTDACLQTITVEDTTMPVLTCPSNTVILCSQPTDPGTTGTATATDACDTAPTLNFNDSVAGSCPATITRTWTATDSCGNSDNCVQTIDVVP